METKQLSEKYDASKLDFFKIMQKYESTRDGHLGKVTSGRHRIVLSLPDAPPIQLALYFAGPKQQEIKLEKLAQTDTSVVAEPAVTEWGLPIVFVPQKNESLCFCDNYRRLNAVTAGCCYLIFRLDECTDSLGETQLFST